MSYQVKPGNIFGRIGTGIGKGLGEQVPKEIERHRLSQGLKDIEKTSSEMTPFQQASALYAVPGGREVAPHLLPLLNQQNASKNYVEQNQGNISRSASQKEISPSSRRDQSNYLKPLSPEDIRNTAAQRFQSNPSLYGNDPQRAEAQVEKEDARRLGQDKSNEDKINLTTARFNEVMSRKLQKNGTATYGDVLGDLQNEYLNKAYDDTSLSPLQAANKYGEKALEFAKAKNKLSEVGSGTWLGTSPSQRLKSIDSIRDVYKKEGRLEEFSKELQSSQDLSPEYASSLSFPVKNNPNLINFLGSEKGKQKPVEKVVEFLKDNLKKDDSLLSIGLELRSRGEDSEKFLQEIKEAARKDQISLTERQQRELQEIPNQEKTLGDLYLFSSLGKYVNTLVPAVTGVIGTPVVNLLKKVGVL